MSQLFYDIERGTRIEKKTIVHNSIAEGMIDDSLLKGKRTCTLGGGLRGQDNVVV